MGGWMCVTNGLVCGTRGNLDERILAAAQVLIGVVRPDSPGTPRPFGPFGPFGPKTSALIAELEASAPSDYEAARKAYIAGDTREKPSPLVSKLKISRASLDALIATIEFLDHKAEVPVQQCEMPNGKTALGLSGDHVMDHIHRVLGANARTKLRLCGARDSWPNLLVMPGMYKNGKGTKFNNIEKKGATVRVEYARHCDMCGLLPSKSVQQNGACGASVLVPDGEKVDLYVCLGDPRCTSGTMVVRGQIVKVTKNLNKHSASAELA